MNNFIFFVKTYLLIIIKTKKKLENFLKFYMMINPYILRFFNSKI